MRSCGGDMKPSVGSRPTRSVVCCRGALDTVSLGLGNPPRCRMGVKKFCARSAVSQHTVLGYCTPQLSPHAYLRSYMVSHRHISSNLLTTFLSLVFRSTFRELGCLDPATHVRPVPGHFLFSRKANRRSTQLRTLSPCTQSPTTAAATWGMLCSLPRFHLLV